MKIFKITLGLVMLLTLATGCKKYLDVVPDERPTDADAFRDPIAAKGYLYSCYGWIPNPRSTTTSLDMLTTDEVTTAFEHETFAKFPRGQYSASDPVISYWNDLYKGIRQCYILIENVDAVPGIDPADAKLYKDEANFLIGYYHFLLVRMYGPIIIADRKFDVAMSTTDYPVRSTYDECVDFVIRKMDEAVSRLPAAVASPTDLGRATSVIASSVKARMLLYAASPLFNGGGGLRPSLYANFKDKSGKQLISATYDKEKWKRAADAAREAIQAAEAAGYVLYKNSTFLPSIPYPSNQVEKDLRYVFIDRQNTREVIWGDSRQEGYYDLQNKSAPLAAGAWNGVAPTLTMVEQFYTVNGLPIDKDPAFNYAGRYNIVSEPNGNTIVLNQTREPRFNAWVASHNSYYEILRNGQYRVLMQMRKNDLYGIQSRSNNYSPTGYLNKKGVGIPLDQTQINWPAVQYPWPVIRLAELYLDYAEALIEYGQDFATAKTNIDKVRTRAGIPTVDAAWAQIGGATSQAQLRDIVRQERTIELYLENHRFWDLRRWQIANQYLNQQAKGMNIQGATDATFFTVATVPFPRAFSDRNYLMPIPQSEIDKNQKLVQTPGY